jgi:hypothetical protein
MSDTSDLVADRPQPRERRGRAGRSHGTAQEPARRGLIHEQFEHAPDTARDELRQSAVAQQNKAALERTLARLHAADIAFVLEALPLDGRLYIWDLVKAERDGRSSRRPTPSASR